MGADYIRRRKSRKNDNENITSKGHNFGMHRPVESKITVLYEDEFVIAVDKPAGVLVTPDRFSPSADTLTNRVWFYLWQKAGGGDDRLAETRPLMVHRLDKETSGVILYAKNIEAQRELGKQFETHRVSKVYLAIVEGRVEERNGRIDFPIGPPPRQTHTTRGKMFIGTPEAKPAITDFKVIEAHDSWSLVEARPRTGRTHQIRLHFSAYGHPLLVDKLYGRRPILMMSDIHPLLGKDDRLLIDRQPLHAASISILRVTGTGKSGERIEIQSPLPEDLSNLLELLRREAP